jgi:aspartyl-tRNA(Asn)/glutamyl-tRNA(Gln) amidotransferase subunit A
MAPALADGRLYRVGAAYEVARNDAAGGSLVHQVPGLEGAK